MTSFAESLAIVGTIVPGAVTLTLIGVLIGSGVIAPLPNFLAIVFGAILGDTISFMIGNHYHQRVKTIWPFHRYPHLLAKGEDFFTHYGSMSIFIGRFFGPIRSILPLVVGMLNMPFRRFIIADTITAFLWAPAYLLPGILLGAATLEMTPEIAARAIFMILIIFIIIAVITWLVHHIGRKIYNYTDIVLTKLWRHLQRFSFGTQLCNLLRDPRIDHHHGQLGLAIAAVASFTAFLIVLWQITHEGSLLAINQSIHTFIQSLRTSNLDTVMVCITMLGEKWVMLGLLLGATVWFVAIGYQRLAWHWLLNGVVICGAIFALKFAVHIARPDGLLQARETFSFPSGHTGSSIAILGFLAVILAQNTPVFLRYYLNMFFIVIISSILFSRLYLGAHWFTDILGSGLLGITIISCTTLSWLRQPKHQLPVVATALVSLSLLLLSWGAFSYYGFAKEFYAYTPQFSINEVQEQRWWQQQQPILPLVRHNRFGRADQYLTVQYVGDVSQLTTQLVTQGWQSVPQYGVLPLLTRMGSNDHTQTLPLVATLYKNHAPVCILIKKMPAPQPLLVLRLWHSGYVIAASKDPIWVGTVDYRMIMSRKWLDAHRTLLATLPEPLPLLREAVTPMTQRQIEYIAPPLALSQLSRDRIKILLIRAKATQ